VVLTGYHQKVIIRLLWGKSRRRSNRKRGRPRAVSSVPPRAG
jgi:hypothetical protein